MNQQLIFKIFFIPVVLIIILFSFISTTSAQENNEIIATVRISICGNGIIEEGEICDSANLNNLTCKDIGYITGELKCSISCDEYETLLCSNISGDSNREETLNEGIIIKAVQEDQDNSDMSSSKSQQIVKLNNQNIIISEQSLFITEIYNSDINYDESQVIENIDNNENSTILNSDVISKAPT